MSKKMKSVDIAYNAIKVAILSGELEPGENLPEIEFSQKLGISRTPFREALNHLSYEGLVNIERYSGGKVTEFSEADIKETIELRVSN